MDSNVEASLYCHIIEAIHESVHFETCIVLDSFTSAQRAGLLIAPSQLFFVPPSVEKACLEGIPLLPPPNYITGFGAELMTYVYFMIPHNIMYR